MKTLAQELSELERTNPEVRAASKKYDEMAARIARPAPAFNVVRGVMVLEEPTGRLSFNERRRSVAYRLTPPTCRHCSGEDFAHLPVGRVLCRNWRPFGIPTVREQLEKRVADVVGRRPENIEALMATLREALS